MASIIVVTVWQGAPYNMLIILAGLVGVDRALYEASALDGVNRLQRIRYVVLPSLKPVFVILFTLAAIRGLRVFTEVFLLTDGGPDASTEVPMTYIYRTGLTSNDLGTASAGAIVLFAATLILTGLVLAISRRKAKS